jgi:hypothetical protein
VQIDETVIVTAPPRGAPGDYFMTFSGPVGVPGVTLQAGVYVFDFALASSRGVIRVRSANRVVTYAMFHAFPASGLGRTSASPAEISWLPMVDGEAHRIASWFQHGGADGWTFIYPQNRVE